LAIHIGDWTTRLALFNVIIIIIIIIAIVTVIVIVALIASVITVFTAYLQFITESNTICHSGHALLKYPRKNVQ